MSSIQAKTILYFKLIKNDGLPQQICSLCAKELHRFVTFRNLCWASKKLLHIINKSQLTEMPAVKDEPMYTEESPTSPANDDCPTGHVLYIKEEPIFTEDTLEDFNSPDENENNAIENFGLNELNHHGFIKIKEETLNSFVDDSKKECIVNEKRANKRRKKSNEEEPITFMCEHCKISCCTAMELQGHCRLSHSSLQLHQTKKSSIVKGCKTKFQAHEHKVIPSRNPRECRTTRSRYKRTSAS